MGPYIYLNEFSQKKKIIIIIGYVYDVATLIDHWWTARSPTHPPKLKDFKG